MKIIILNGASCSGKSTIIKEIMKKKNLFHLSYDSLKWSFADYKPEKHRKKVKKIFLAVANCVLKMKYNIVSDSNMNKNERVRLIRLAQKMKYEIIEINLETDLKELLKRFNKRVTEHSKNPDRKLSNKSKKRFVEIYNIFNKDKNKKATTFYTDKQGINEISKNILKLLKD